MPAQREPKILTLDAILPLRNQWRQQRKTVVWTNGCFDLLHIGHVQSLRSARNLGDVLVVGVNSDESVARLKGPGRPIVPAAERAEIVAALECVDCVLIFGDPTPERVLSELQPEIHTKGIDYAPPDGKAIPEAALVRSYGGRIEYLPLVPFVSTTDRVRRIQELLAARKGGGRIMSPSLTEILDAFEGKRIVCLGDVMLDEYLVGNVQRILRPKPRCRLSRFTATLMCPAARQRGRQRRQPGRAGTPGRRCIDSDYQAGKLQEALLQKGVVAEGLRADSSLQTTTKTRIIAHRQQVARVDHERRRPLPAALENDLLDWAAEQMTHADACILSDYAKGVVSQRVAAQFLALAQRAGLAVVVDPKGTDYAKYRGATVVKPNLHEAERMVKFEIATEADLDSAGQTLLGGLGGAALLITRGPHGMSLFEPGAEPVHISSAAREIFDVTGEATP